MEMQRTKTRQDILEEEKNWRIYIAIYKDTF